MKEFIVFLSILIFLSACNQSEETQNDSSNSSSSQQTGQNNNSDNDYDDDFDLGDFHGGGDDEEEQRTPEELASIAAFENTLFPIIIPYCDGCHALQNPKFALATDAGASHDLILAQNLANLNSPGASRLVTKVTGGHNCWSNCNSDADDLEQAISDWADLIND